MNTKREATFAALSAIGGVTVGAVSPASAAPGPRNGNGNDDDKDKRS